MSKRFTDTTKWKRPWFRGLSIQAKLVWIYLCDECDHAGIWLADFSLISFQVGFKVTPEKLQDWLGDKIIKVDHDKYFLPSFFEFQYGSAKDGFKAKQSAREKLKAFGLIDENGEIKQSPDTQVQSMDCTSISNSIINNNINNNNNIKNKEISEKKITDTDLDPIYALYPRKVGKTRGYALAKKLSREELDDLRRAVSNYRSATEKTESRFIKHFSTFMGEWRDWLEWQPDAPESPPSIEDVKARVEAYRRSLEAL